MTTDDPQPGDLEQARMLIDRLCDATLSPEETQSLQRLLLRNADVRQLYIRVMNLHGTLFNQISLAAPRDVLALDRMEDAPSSLNESLVIAAIRDVTPFDPDEPAVYRPMELPISPPKRTGWTRFLTQAAAAAVLLGVGTAIWFARPGSSPNSAGPIARLPDPAPSAPATQPAPAPSFAQLDDAIAPVWAGGTAPAVGLPLPTGELQLASGTARLTVGSGATVILEGPATFTVDAPGRVRLVSGKLSARVNHERADFTVSTPTAQVVDLGTEFGVSVQTNATAMPPVTQVRVFDGAVQVASAADSPTPAGRTIVAGQGCSVSDAGLQPIADARSMAAFVRVADFDRKQQAIQSALATVSHPDLLAWTYFDEEFKQFAASRGLTALTVPKQSADERTQITGESVLAGNPLGRSQGTNAKSAAFIRLDTSPDSPLAKHGYVGPDGFIDRDGRTLYLSWLSTAELAVPSGFGGLSLADGNIHRSNEFVFFGQVLRNPNFSCDIWRTSRDAPETPPEHRVVDLNFSAEGQPPLKRPVDTKTHLWVVKIAFRPGPDEISVFLDPPTEAEPARANLKLDNVDLQFDRVRLTAGSENNPWRFNRLLLGASYPSVVPPQATAAARPE